MSTNTPITQEDIQSVADNIVRNDVIICVSTLISTLSSMVCDNAMDALETEDLMTLGGPRLDYEEAATDYVNNADAGTLEDIAQWLGMPIDTWTGADAVTSFMNDTDAHALFCGHFDIDPHEMEVLEHWAVSNYLADKLDAQGEIVVKDFMGFNVWARTTSGQHISIDGVIQQIARVSLEASKS